MDVPYVRGDDMPIFGRRFVVFFNRIEMGDIEVSPTGGIWGQEHGVEARLQLRHLGLVPFVDARQLVASIELLCGPSGTREVVWAQANGAAIVAMTGYLWDAVRVDANEAIPLFEHDSHGPGTALRESVAHWTKNNVAPESLVAWRNKPRGDV